MLMRHIVLFTATVMIGNERVELMLFDTTGQVMTTALASVRSALSSPSSMQSLSRSHFRIASYTRRTTFRRYTVNHPRQLSVIIYHKSVTSFQ